jgi:hypothetical protein
LAETDAEQLLSQTKSVFACLHGLIKAVEKEAGITRTIAATITSLIALGVARLVVGPVVL